MEWQKVDNLLRQIPLLAELQAARESINASVWLVGGCVRDLLIGREPADIDVASENPHILALRFAELIGHHVVTMDAERGIWRVGISADRYFDFCRFRDEDILGDLAGRDYTINAIAVRLPEAEGDSGGLFDPFNGLQDLNDGILRMVNARAFKDDPLRILRGFRFNAELPLQFDDDTWNALPQEALRLPQVAPERTLAEWWKLCGGARAAQAIERMDEAGVLTILFPELAEMKGVGQNAYHRFDVWEHSLLTVSYMAK